jgi:3-methyl-2-oxobutanoate hydroxymethyltransferase
MNSDKPKKITVPGLAEMKSSGEPITMLTAYDASFAFRVDQPAPTVCWSVIRWAMSFRAATAPAGDCRDMVYHTEAVRRGLERALLIADMPFMSYHDRATAMDGRGG